MAEILDKKFYKLKLSYQSIILDCGGKDYCPFCCKELTSDDVVTDHKCSSCNESLTPTEEYLSEVLRRNKLEQCIPVLKEAELLDAPALYSLKKKEFYKLNLEKKDAKKLYKLCGHHKGSHILLAIIAFLVLAVIITVLVLALSLPWYVYAFLVFALLFLL